MALDSHLTRPFELIVIGGAAALLKYGVQRTTEDIDTLDPGYRKIAAALEAAKRDTGLDIHIEYAAVSDPPQNYADRLELVPIQGLRRLVIKVPEKHDLVLMKAVRGEEQDLQVAEEIHKTHPLERDVLVDRCIDEMGQASGDPRRLDGNLLVLLERLFGGQDLDEVDKRLTSKRGERQPIPSVPTRRPVGRRE